MTLKEIVEKKGAVRAAMKAMLDKVHTENRAVSEEEEQQFAAYEKELADLERTEQIEKRAQALDPDTPEVSVEGAASGKEKRAEKKNEISAGHAAVNAYIRGQEVRAGEMSTTENGVIPNEFSADIIHSVRELSGIISHIGIANSKGDYTQIAADSANQITAAWTSELGEIEPSSAKFKKIVIGHHKLTSLYIASDEVINQNQFDIAAECNQQMSQDFAYKSETAIIKGTGTDQPTGLTSGGTVYTMASATEITAEDIVRMFHKLKSTYQMNACWLMSNDTLCNIRLLKGADGHFYFHQSEMANGYAGTILGKPVLISEAMDNVGASKLPIMFGDFGRAYKANINPDISIQVLMEKYATSGGRGVLGKMWIDGKPVNNEAYVVGKMAAK